MSKVSLVLNYWIFIVVVLIIAKILKIADNNKLMMITIGFATLFYIILMMFASRRQGATAGKSGRGKNK